MNKKNKLKLYMSLFATGMIFALNGCGNTAAMKIENETKTQNTTPTENLSVEAVTKETVTKEMEQTYNGECLESCVLQEDEQYFYFCGSCRVSKVDKATGEEVILWENSEEVSSQKEYVYSRGTGILIDEELVFVENWYEENDLKRAVSRVKTDGTGYERIIEMKYAVDDIMMWQDGVLYADDMDRVVEIKFSPSGDIIEKNIQDKSYEEKLYYEDNGSRMLFEQQSLAEFGAFLKQTDDGYVMSINPETGEKEYLDKLTFFEGYNSKYFLTSTYEDGMMLHLVDRETGEDRELFEREDFFRILAMDEEYVYIVRIVYEEEVTQYSYERIALADGQVEELFVRQPEGLWSYSTEVLMDTIVKNGYIYYVDEQDYALWCCRRAIEAPQKEEILGDAIYDSGIADIGEMQSKNEKMYSEKEPEKLLYNVNLSWLAVDDKYPGSNLINTYVFAHQEANMSYAREQYEYMMEDMWDCGTSEFSSIFPGFTYVDSHYISFYQQEYEYQAGAAHGMPWWIGFTFDLESGERMLLSDLVYNSEDELKAIVAKHFEEMAASRPEGTYWEDAVSYVHDTVNMESEFYLTEEGIVFFYGPYELACYAEGFQEVLVPYQEFDLRIILDNIK